MRQSLDLGITESMKYNKKVTLQVGDDFIIIRCDSNVIPLLKQEVSKIAA